MGEEEKYNLLQIAALLELFERDNNREAVDMSELTLWLLKTDLSYYGEPIKPEKVFDVIPDETHLPSFIKLQ